MMSLSREKKDLVFSGNSVNKWYFSPLLNWKTCQEFEQALREQQSLCTTNCADMDCRFSFLKGGCLQFLLNKILWQPLVTHASIKRNSSKQLWGLQHFSRQSTEVLRKWLHFSSGRSDVQNTFSHWQSKITLYCLPNYFMIELDQHKHKSDQQKILTSPGDAANTSFCCNIVDFMKELAVLSISIITCSSTTLIFILAAAIIASSLGSFVALWQNIPSNGFVFFVVKSWAFSCTVNPCKKTECHCKCLEAKSQCFTLIN